MTISVFKNIVGDQSIKKFFEYYEVRDNTIDDRPDVFSKHPIWDEGNWPQLELQKILDQVLDHDYVIEETIFNKSKISFNLHVDSLDGDPDVLYKNVLIPIHFEGPSSTVIFENKWHGSATRFSKVKLSPFFYRLPTHAGVLEPVEDIRLLTDLSNYDITREELDVLIAKRDGSIDVLGKSEERTSDYSLVEGYDPNLKFDKQLHEQYLNHIPIESLDGLTVGKVVDWHIGDVITFDRQHLHCAGSGHSVKYGITVFTKRSQ